MEGNGTKIDDRVQFLQNFIMDNPVLGDFDIDLISERISKLKGGLIVIQPGGCTQVEMNECRDRIEDSLSAVRAAIESGYLPGGGSALLHASNCLVKLKSDEASFNFGVNVVKKACEAPFRKLI